MMLHFAKNLLLIVCITLFYAHSQAQIFPKDVVPIISVGGPGGFNSQIVQALQPVVANILGAQVPVDYKTGGNGVVALTHITGIARERTTLMIGPWFANTKFDLLTDVKPVLHLGESSLMVYVRSDNNVKSLRELLTTKTKITLGSSVPNTVEILLNTVKQNYPNSDITSVNYRSGIEAITAVLGGHIDVGVTPAPALMPFIADNRLVAIANLSTGRSPVMPNISTIQEQTKWRFDGYPYLSWFMYASLGTDNETVLRLRRQLSHYILSQDGKNFLAKFDLVTTEQTFAQPEVMLKTLQPK